MKEETAFELTPNRGVGPFLFGEQIATYVNDNLVEADGEPYVLGGDLHQSFVLCGRKSIIRIRCDYLQKIESIDCYESLWFGGSNLIGRKLYEFAKLTGHEVDVDDEDIELDGNAFRTAFNDELGVQLWVLNNAIHSVCCFDGNE